MNREKHARNSRYSVALWTEELYLFFRFNVVGRTGAQE